VEGPFHLKASFIPNTDPVATLVPKKKKKKKKISGDGAETGATPHFPRAGRRNTFMEGGSGSLALILHSEQ
jgi:hypothetical protein